MIAYYIVYDPALQAPPPQRVWVNRFHIKTLLISFLRCSTLRSPRLWRAPLPAASSPSPTYCYWRRPPAPRPPPRARGAPAAAAAGPAPTACRARRRSSRRSPRSRPAAPPQANAGCGATARPPCRPRGEGKSPRNGLETGENMRKSMKIIDGKPARNGRFWDLNPSVAHRRGVAHLVRHQRRHLLQQVDLVGPGFKGCMRGII